MSEDVWACRTEKRKRGRFGCSLHRSVSRMPGQQVVSLPIKLGTKRKMFSCLEKLSSIFSIASDMLILLPAGVACPFG